MCQVKQGYARQHDHEWIAGPTCTMSVLRFFFCLGGEVMLPRELEQPDLQAAPLFIEWVETMRRRMQAENQKRRGQSYLPNSATLSALSRTKPSRPFSFAKASAGQESRLPRRRRGWVLRAPLYLKYWIAIPTFQAIVA